MRKNTRLSALPAMVLCLAGCGGAADSARWAIGPMKTILRLAAFMAAPALFAAETEPQAGAEAESNEWLSEVDGETGEPLEGEELNAWIDAFEF